MDWIGLPPLASLKAFEAAARHKGYSAAGRELNVSHAAIARQVRALEAFLGVPLAERAGRGIALSPEGEVLAAGLCSGFEQVAATVRALSDTEARRPLQITMTPLFATGWFLPRLQLFRAAHPGIELSINPTAINVDMTDDRYDVAIRYGDGSWSGVLSESFVESDFLIVGAPSLLAGRDVTCPEDLLQLPWLQEFGTNEIAQWLAGHGIESLPQANVTELPGYMMLPAVREGQGVGVVARLFIEDDIATGRLVPIFEDKGRVENAYHLIYRPGIQRPSLKVFLKWLRQASREYAKARTDHAQS